MKKAKSVKVASILVLALILVLASATALHHQTYETSIRQELASKNFVIVDLWKSVPDPKLESDWNLIEVTEHGYHYQIISRNIIPNVGQEWLQGQVSGSPSTSAAIYIALCNGTGTPAYTDTSIPNEYNSDGLARAAGTYTAGSAANGDITWTVKHTFTASASFTNVRIAGLFTTSVSSQPTLFAETTLATFDLDPTNTVSITWVLAITN